MNPVSSPFDFESFENTLHQWVADSTGLTTVWQKQGSPQPPYPFCTLSIVSGPTLASPMWEERDTYIDPVMILTIDLLPVSEALEPAGGQSFTVVFNGHVLTYITDVTPTIVEVCAGLKSLIDALHDEVTVVATATKITITAKTEDDAFWIQVADHDLIVDVPAQAYPVDTVKLDHLVPCKFVVGVQARVSKDDSVIPTSSSRNYLARALAALEHTDYRAAFNSVGVGVFNKGEIKNLDQLLPDQLMSWAALDVTFGTRLSTSEYLSFIEHVAIKSTGLGIDEILEVEEE